MEYQQMIPTPRMKKALSEPNYQMNAAGATRNRLVTQQHLNGGHRQNSPAVDFQRTASTSNDSNASSRKSSVSSNAPLELSLHTRRYRSLSLQHNQQSSFSLKSDHGGPELISLSNMPKELGLEKKTSISFSAVGFMVESMHRLHKQVADKKPEVEKAVFEGDVPSLRSLCSSDEVAASIAAFAALKDDKADILVNILDMGDYDCATHCVSSNEGEGLLQVAVTRGAEKCVRTLLSRGFDANQWDEEGRSTPMHCAAEAGKIDMLDILIEEGGGNVNEGGDCVGEERHTVLQAAIKANQIEVVRYLLEKKASKMGRGKFTETALHTACDHNREDCARLLLKDGTLVDALRGEDTRETALHIAASNGYLETTVLLLQHSADPNAKNVRGETPLHLASRMLAGSVMRALLDAGADIDSIDREGRPSLHFAINSKQRGGAECTQILIDRNANLNLGDENGTTALHLAALNRKLSRVKQLIRSGADLCIRNKAGKSALHFVMKYVPNSMKTIEERMDGGLTLDNPESEYDNTVKINFNLLIPSATNTSFVSEVGLFTEILQMHNNDPARLEKIFMHPLSLSFLHLKWQQIKWLYYFFILFSHFVYSLTYSLYAVLIFNTLCKPEEDDVDRMSLSERWTMIAECQFDREDKAIYRDLALTAWVFLIAFNVLYVMKETTKLIHLRDHYFKEWESCLNLLTIVTFPLISFHSNPFSSSSSSITFSAWQFHSAGIGVLITWILMMFLIGKVPRFGKYVQMLMNVGWSFFNFFVAYFPLILGFSLSFVIVFPREVSFRDAITAPVKVMVMMTGEIEYNDLYYPQRNVLNFSVSEDGRSGYGVLDEEQMPQFFPLTAHVVLTTFIVVVAIVIMNLLFGMAVSDVQELYKKSRLHQSIQQVHLISYMESILFSPLFQKLPLWAQKFLRRKLHGLEGRYRNVCEIELDSYDENKLMPHHLNKTIKDKCFEMHQKRDDLPTIRGLHSHIKHLENKVETLTEAIQRLVTLQDPANRFSNATTLSLDDEEDSNDEDKGLYLGLSTTTLEDDMTDSCHRSPQKRESQLSMTPLEKIRELEDEGASSLNSVEHQ